MKVLLLAPQPFFEERGTPIAVRWVAETLVELGHDVDLLAFPFGQDVPLPGVRVHRCARPPGVKRVPIGFSFQKVLCDVNLVRAAHRLLRESRHDVIHACEESIFPALALAKRHRAKLVYDMDSSMAEQLMEKWGWLRAFRGVLEGFEKRAARGANLVLPVCSSLAEKARRLAPGQDVVILHDMAIQSPPIPAGTEDLRSALGVQGPLALYVGNLEHYQGIDLMIDGFEQAGTEAHLVIIGGIEKDVAAYRALVQRRGLGGRVHVLGPRPLNRLQYYLDQADILVSPRLRGVNTPMKVYSYLLAGKAVVATRILSHTQVLEEEFACLVDPDPAAMGGALRELARDAALRARLGAAAARVARERHSREAYRETLQRAYGVLQVA